MARIALLTFLVSNLLTVMVAAQGTQFITGECASDAECASGCCGFTSGKCAAPLVAQERGEDCGFGDAVSNLNALGGGGANNAADDSGNNNDNNTENNNGDNNDVNNDFVAPAVAAPTTSAAANAAGAGNGAGTQFITGACTSDADCASGCCGFNSGKCAGPVIAQERDGGCGFGDAQPNDDAAQNLKSKGKRFVQF